MIDESTWEDLLSFIEVGHVIPILGSGVTTIEPDNSLLMPWVTERLANELQVEVPNDEPFTTLNDVVCRYLMNGGRQQLVHTRLHRVIRDSCPAPGRTLKQLASIDPLRFFISTTSDPLLVNALGEIHGESNVDCLEYSPSSANKDLPSRVNALTNRTVYQILGKASPAGSYVVWEDDMMEFIFGLHKDLSLSVMPNLSKDLADPDMHFMILGLNFSDWLVRFFIRAARQNSFSKSSGIDYIADDSNESVTSGLVMFLSSAGRNINVLKCDPREFVAELSKRWHAQEEKRPKPTDQSLKPRTSQHDSLRETIFLSYAREDEAAAFNLKNGLESRGMTVWLDQCELDNGTNFDRELKQTVMQKCAFFVSLISRTTESQREAYFHAERNWAARRAEHFSDHDRGSFYHPVVIDDLEIEMITKEPEQFRSSHCVSLLDGKITDAFASRLETLLKAQGATL